MTHRLRNVPRGLFLENDDTQSRVNSDSNLSQNRLKRTMRQASWTKPRKLWAWYSQQMKKLRSSPSIFHPSTNRRMYRFATGAAIESYFLCKDDEAGEFDKAD